MRIFEIDQYDSYNINTNSLVLDPTWGPKPMVPRINAGSKLDVDEYYNLIKTNCQTYLGEVRKARKPMVRGMQTREHQNRLAFTSSSRPNRVPTGSHPEAQVKFDGYLVELGVKALRSNSTFVSGATTFSEIFGKLYVIFPYDNAPYAWSGTHNDIIISNDRYHGMGKYDNVEDFNKEYDIQTTNLHQALKDNHEVWFSGTFVALEYKTHIVRVREELIGLSS